MEFSDSKIVSAQLSTGNWLGKVAWEKSNSTVRLPNGNSNCILMQLQGRQSVRFNPSSVNFATSHPRRPTWHGQWTECGIWMPLCWNISCVLNFTFIFARDQGQSQGQDRSWESHCCCRRLKDINSYSPSTRQQQDQGGTCVHPGTCPCPCHGHWHSTPSPRID